MGGGGIAEEEDDGGGGGAPHGPTAGPTPRSSSPSSISGAIWYDANSDGMMNSLPRAASSSDQDASFLEGGSGVVRLCGTHELAGATRTGPRSENG